MGDVPEPERYGFRGRDLTPVLHDPRSTVQDVLHFSYEDGQGARTERTVRPLCLAFWGTAWTATAWCELRGAFRNFRPDRMRDATLLEERFEDEPGRDLPAFLRLMEEARRRRGEVHGEDGWG